MGGVKVKDAANIGSPHCQRWSGIVFFLEEAANRFEGYHFRSIRHRGKDTKRGVPQIDQILIYKSFRLPPLMCSSSTITLECSILGNIFLFFTCI